MGRRALAILAAGLLTACGGQATSQSPPSSSPAAGQTAVASPTPSPSTTVITTPVATPRPTAAPTPPPPLAAAVRVIDFAFNPSSLTVRVGTRVTFTNRGAATHTVTADGGLFNSGDLPSGKSYSFTFMSAGSFAYHCQIHPSMTGTITTTR